MLENDGQFDRPEKKNQKDGAQPSQNFMTSNSLARGLTSWVSTEGNKAIYLMETESAEILRGIDVRLNGNSFPVRFVEVDSSEFEAIVKRLNELGNSEKPASPVIKPSEVVMILVCDVKHLPMGKEETRRFYEFKSNFKKCLREKIEGKGGKLLNYSLLLTIFSFPSAQSAIQSALELQENFKANLDPELRGKVQMKIGLSGLAGFNDISYADDLMKTARRMAYVARNQIVLCPRAEEVCKYENLNPGGEGNKLICVGKQDHRFLTGLFDYMERHWQDEALHVDDLADHLGCSKSQVYRKMIALSGMSPNLFIKEYRLDRAVDLFHTSTNNIAEVAFEAGFSSPSYFTKCFHKRYRMTPSDYIQAASVYVQTDKKI